MLFGNKIGVTHVICLDAKAAGKRFCIEASVREIERVSVCGLNLQRMAKPGLQHEGQQFLPTRRTGSHADQALGIKERSFLKPLSQRAR